MDVFFWAIAPRVVFWTRFEANFRLGGNRRPLFLNGLTSPRVPGQLRKTIIGRLSMLTDILSYKDYHAEVSFDASADEFHVRVIGIKDVIDFYGKTPADL